MNLTEFFSVVLVFLHCSIEIGCLEITLDRFEIKCIYLKEINCNASATAMYDVRGTIVLNVGEELPKYLVFYDMCPASNECLTRSGSGSWEWIQDLTTTPCRENHTDYYFGCYLLKERTYGFYAELGYFYYYTRLCKYSVRPCDETFEVCGSASNDINVSDIRTVSRYGYFTSEDEYFQSEEKECRDKRQRSAHNGKEEKRHPSDDSLMIFGVVLAINMIAIY